MAAKKYWYISQTDLMDRLSETEMQMIGGACIFKTFQKKDLIFSPDDPAQRIYILEEGTVTLYKVSPDGKKVILDILTPVTIFGDVSFFYDTAQDHYAEASSDVKLCVVPKEDFLNIIERRPEIALKLLEITSYRLRQAEHKVHDIAAHDARSRVVNQLVRLASNTHTATNTDSAGRLTIHTRLTHEMLANMIGLTRETTTKLLNELERDGIIQRGENRTIVIDMNKVRAT